MQAIFDWGLDGALALPDAVAAVAVVDVLSFSTCVDVAVARGAAVLPYPLGRDGAAQAARDAGALLAGRRSDPQAQYTLSPGSLATLPPGSAVLLPSPNGARISFALKDRAVFAGCLRNAAVVAGALRACAATGPVAVIAAGERWPDTGGLRPALEDLLGAGAILEALALPGGPDVVQARTAWAWAKPDLAAHIHACPSGRELAGLGYAQDVGIAIEVDVSRAVPMLANGAFRNRAPA